MKFGTKEISDLSDDELWAAIHSVGGMDGFRIDKLAASRKRHKTLFDKHPPTENVAFTNLTIALNNEYKNRNLKNV